MSARTKKTLFFLTLMCVPILGIAQTYIPSGGLEILNTAGEAVIRFFDNGDAEFDGSIDASEYRQDGVVYDLSAMGSGAKHTVAEENVTLTSRAKLNFIGPTITASDNAVNDSTDVTVNAVAGPSSSTDNALPRFHSTSGKEIQASSVTLDDTNSLGNVNSISAVALDLANPLEVAYGGTGADTFTDAGVLIGNGSGVIQTTSAGTAGQVLTSNGTGVDPTFQSFPGGGDALTTGTLGQFASTPSSDLASVLNNESGTGLAVFNNSPTLITPNLGTPSVLNLSNATGLTVPGGGTGVASFTDAGVLIGNGTGALQATSAGTAGQVLTSNGTGVDPTFQNLSRITALTGDVTASGSGSVTATIASGAVDIDMLSATGTPSASTYLRGDNTWATIAGGGTGIDDGDILSTGLTFPNVGLHLLDTNASHDLIIAPGSDLSADRTLTINTGDLNRSLTLSADATVGGTNSGDISLSGTPDYLSLSGQVLTVNKVDIDDLDTTGTASSSVFLRGDGAWTAIVGGDPTYGSAGGASDNAVYVDADNQMGLGTTTPTSSIHIYDETLPPTITYQFFSESGGDVTQYAGTATSGTGGVGGTWVSPTYISANDGSYVTTFNIGPQEGPSQPLKATNFSFSIPTGATIDGVEVDIEVHSEDGNEDYSAKLIIGGTVQEVDKATGLVLTTTPTVITYGGPLDTWSESLTPEAINSSDFGFQWQGEYTPDTGGNFYVDYITITVYYTELGGDHTWATGISLAGGEFVFRENATDHISISKTTGDTTFLGDVTAAAFIGDGSGLTGISSTVSDGSITNAKLANMAEATIKGRASGAGTGAPTDLTASQVRTILNVADGATANTGTVTSVAVSGSDGIDVDSGSPVTTSGTVALGVNAATLYAHLVSTASTVTGVSGDTLLISDSSAAGALAEIAITDLILAGSSTDNRIPKRNGTAGQLEDSGISIDDSNNVSGMGTLNSHAIPSGSGALVSTDATQTLTNKDVVERELTDSSTPVDVNATNYDTVVTVLSANTTFNAPSSPPRNGKRLFYMVQQAATGGPYTSTWNGVFRSPDSWGLSNAIPAVSTTAGAWDYFLFIWNDATDTWDLLATSAPL